MANDKFKEDELLLAGAETVEHRLGVYPNINTLFQINT